MDDCLTKRDAFPRAPIPQAFGVPFCGQGAYPPMRPYVIHYPFLYGVKV